MEGFNSGIKGLIMFHACYYRINAFLEGFYDIIPKRLISIFNEQELELLISGLPNVDIEDLRANTEYHKYQPTSLQVRFIMWAASISEKLKKLGIAGYMYCFRAGPVVNPSCLSHSLPPYCWTKRYMVVAVTLELHS
jgi:hypothetical protein